MSLRFIPHPVPKLAVGDEVFVVGSDRGRTVYTRTTVTSSGRLWLRARGEHSRFSAATLDSERAIGHRSRLLTADMMEREAALASLDARFSAALARAGVVVRRMEVWPEVRLSDAAALALVEALEGWATVHAPGGGS